MKRVEREIEVVVEHRCDLCGAELPEERGYEVRRVEVRAEVGTCYPEGGEHEVTEFDLCSRCFFERLVPWMKEQGAEPQVLEVNY
jgi:hypothetical protein